MTKDLIIRGTRNSLWLVAGLVTVLGWPSVAAAANITGTITFAGKPPALKPLPMDAEPVCQKKHGGPGPNEALVLGTGNTMGNVMVWVSKGLPAGKTSEQVAITMDLTATILAATATVAPPGHRPEGIDLLPILRGDSALADRQLFWRIATPNRQQKAVRAGRWKLLVDGSHLLLFDLRADPGEKQDLAAQRPDLVVKLKTLLEAWEKDVDLKPQANQ